MFSPIRTNLRTQSPVCRATLEELGGIRMLLALVHVATGTHTALDALEDRAKWAAACQSFQQRTGAITDHLCQLDQTALFVPAWANRMMSQCCSSSPISLA